MRNLSRAVLLVVLLSGCFSKNQEEARRQIHYFDLRSYFIQKAQQLNQENTPIQKTVSTNKLSERKRIKVADWNAELALFIDADINKPAWRDSYVKDSTATKVIYTAKDNDLKTQMIEIDLNAGEPKKITIQTQVNNILYHSTEQLEFIPDSIYIINKHQKVILLGLNDYQIEGRFR